MSAIPLSHPDITNAEIQAVVNTLRAELPDIEQYVCIGDPPDWAVSFESVMHAGPEQGPPIRSNPAKSS